MLQIGLFSMSYLPRNTPFVDKYMYVVLHVYLMGLLKHTGLFCIANRALFYVILAIKYSICDIEKSPKMHVEGIF